MTEQMSPNKIESDVLDRLVNDPQNPSNCSSGWYIYYLAVCGHEAQQMKYTCGGRRAQSGRSVFCKTPAPRRNVDAVRIDVKCGHC